jgi:hypothetical protein
MNLEKLKHSSKMIDSHNMEILFYSQEIAQLISELASKDENKRNELGNKFLDLNLRC